MKNIFKTGLLAFAMMFIAFACSEDDNTTAPNTFFISVQSDAGSGTALPNNTLDIDLNLRASQGIGSLTVDGGAITVTDGATEETVTYTYTVPGASEVFGSITLTFILTDADGNSAEFEFTVNVAEDAETFAVLDMIDLGAGEGAAEISAYDTATMQLFVVNNDDAAGNNQIDVLDFEDPSDISLVSSIDLSSFGGGANSVAVSQGRLAVAVENNDKQANGVVLVYNTSSLATAPQQITVGALPDMVAWTPDGNYILVANEGEPNDDYTVDPDGTVSIIDASDFTVATATFDAFNSEEATLEAAGLRVFGPGADLAADVEPEYIVVSSDSETAYVALQENNGLAVVDIATATVTDIVPLGFKDYTAAGNEIDPSDDDGLVTFRSNLEIPLFGVYQPDGMAAFNLDGTDYIITANEGDSREYEGTPGFVGEDRVADVTLDGTVFDDANIQLDASFGRLKMMLDLGDPDGDNDYDAIYSYGARSFSIWDADGELVWDSGNDLDVQALAAGIYADGRSDDKSVEPEGVAVGVVNGQTLAFIGLERVDAVAVYNVSSPSSPSFVAMIEAGDAPEGLVFIPASESPNDRSLLVVSSEDDGVVTVYQTN